MAPWNRNPSVPSTPCPCVPRSFGTPFGGAASGLWPSGGGAQPATPAPVAPAPTCVTPLIFADCFAVCSGVMSEVSPGPLCGWTYDMSQGSPGGTVTFAPGSMSFDTDDASDFPAARKPLPAPLVTVNGLTGQYSFTEYPSVPNVATAYNLYMTNFDLSEVVVVGLLGDGSVFFQVGDPAAAPSYFGAWTPNNGSHTIHFSIDALGVPAIWIDGVSIPLTFFGNIPSFAASEPANHIAFGFGSGDAAVVTAPLTNVFVTAGSLSPSTEFCCPT